MNVSIRCVYHVDMLQGYMFDMRLPLSPKSLIELNLVGNRGSAMALLNVPRSDVERGTPAGCGEGNVADDVVDDGRKMVVRSGIGDTRLIFGHGMLMRCGRGIGSDWHGGVGGGLDGRGIRDIL